MAQINKSLMIRIIRLDFFRNFPQFLKVFQDKNRRLNLILLTLFFLIFPSQNYYQSLQPKGSRPLAREINFSLPEMAKQPINKTGVKAPFLSARSVFIIDIPSKTIILSKNPDLSLLPASTTKIMTALVALEEFELNETLLVKEELEIGQVVGLKKGQQFKFEDLLYGLLVGSGNDAAFIIAQNYPQGITAFIEKMNQKANELCLQETNFINVTGVEAYSHKTTSHDLAILTAEALKNSTFRKVVSTKEIKIADLSGKKEYLLKNTNKLVGEVLGVKGVKTGWTEHADECLVTYVEREQGQILLVLLGSQDRFGETKKLINWVYQNFDWQTIDTNYQQLPGQDRQNHYPL